MKKQVLLPLLSILIVVGGLFGWSQGAGNSVLLGLDLKGGAEVVLEPVEDTELSGDALDEFCVFNRFKNDLCSAFEI